MTDLILIVLVAVILSAAIGYIIRKKRSGATCIGCPNGHSCPHSKGGCSCHGYK